MKDFIKINNDILQTLRSTDFGPLTVLLISDSAFDRLPYDTVSDLKLNPGRLTAVSVFNQFVHSGLLTKNYII